MSSTELTIQENNFIENILNGKTLKQAAELAGYGPTYGAALRKRLSKFIVEAAEEHLALHAIKAATTATDALDEDNIPNPVRLSAAWGILDRVGVIKKEQTQGPVIKANIFILPEKQAATIESTIGLLNSNVVIDHEPS